MNYGKVKYKWTFYCFVVFTLLSPPPLLCAEPQGSTLQRQPTIENPNLNLTTSSLPLPWNEETSYQSNLVEVPNTQGETVDIVYCVNGDYIEGVGASMTSILRNTEVGSRSRLRFNILTGEEADHLEAWLRLIPELNVSTQGPSVIVKKFDTALVDGKYRVRTEGQRRLDNPLNFARFYLYVYFPYLKKFVYVDADTIIQKDIVQLFDKSLKQPARREDGSVGDEPFMLAAFSNSESSFRNYFNMEHPLVKGKFGPDEYMFEAGFFIGNLERWIKEGIIEELWQWVELNNREHVFEAGSQPPLMAVFYKRFENIKEISDWRHRQGMGNEFPAGRRPASHNLDRLGDVGVLEWNGDKKPWSDNPAWRIVWTPYRVPQRWKNFMAKRTRRQQLQDSK